MFDNWEHVCFTSNWISNNLSPQESYNQFKNFSEKDHYSYSGNNHIEYGIIDYCYEEDIDEYDTYEITEVDINSDSEDEDEEYHYYYEF